MSTPPAPPGSSPDFLLQLFANPLEPGYADAAARRQARADAGEPEPAWRRRGALLLRTLTLLATGLLLAIAYREAVATSPEHSQAQAGLVQQVRAAQARDDDLQHSADQLSGEVNRLQESALGGVTDQLRQIRQMEAATGLAKVTGPGVVVRLADGPAPIDPKTGKPSDSEAERVLDRDLQNVVNGLWASGAEAISLGGQRLTATSTIRAAGSAVLVDFQPITSPYEISAVGPPDLATRFRASSAAADMRGLADRYGIGFTVRSESSLTLPAAGTDAPLRYARPVPSTTQPSSSPPSSSPPSSSPLPTPR